MRHIQIREENIPALKHNLKFFEKLQIIYLFIQKSQISWNYGDPGSH